MKEINSTEFDLEVLQGGKVILDFYSTECPPCEALASKFEDLSKLYGNDIKFLKIFRQRNRDLAEKLEDAERNRKSRIKPYFFFKNKKYKIMPAINTCKLMIPNESSLFIIFIISLFIL